MLIFKHRKPSSPSTLPRVTSIAEKVTDISFNNSKTAGHVSLIQNTRLTGRGNSCVPRSIQLEHHDRISEAAD